MNSLLVERLGWVLVHSWWQFAAVAVLAGVVERVLRRSSAAARYGVFVGAMGLMVAGPVATWGWQQANEREARPGDSIAIAPAQHLLPESDAGRLPTVDVAMPSRQDASPAPALVGDAAAVPRPADETPPVEITVTSGPNLLERMVILLRPWLAWIVAAWSLGVALCSARPLFGWYTLRRLRRVGVSPVSKELLAALDRVSRRLGVRRTVRLLQSTLAQVPMVVGYFRPLILLPVSLVAKIPVAQMEALLAHELAHVRRHDFAVNLLQTLIETLFFYHPAVWWLSRRIRVERENSCDDLVVNLFDNRVEYGRALVAIEQLRGHSTVLALGAADGSLLSRVRRIVGSKPDHRISSLWSSLSLVACGVGAVLVLSVVSWSSLAETGDMPARTSADNETPEQAKQAELGALVQLDPPLVAGDFSKVDDPEVLLDQLAKSQLPSLAPMSGGGFFHQPGAPPQATFVRLWESQFGGDGQLDPRIRRLIELQDRAVPRVHQRLNGLAATDVLATHLTLVLRSVGGTESVPVLIKLLKTAPSTVRDGTQSADDFGKGFQASVTQFAATSALWKLTGRKHVFTPDQWQKWWQSVQPDFVVPRDRKRPEFVSRVTPERVQALVNDLATNEVAARERLISLGPAALPHLLKVLAADVPAPPLNAADQDAAKVSPQSVRLAWVIDELGATDKLPAKLRRDYFTQRFEDEGAQVAVFPLDEQAACRALSHCSFADFCAICLKADAHSQDQYGLRLRGWMHLNSQVFSRRFNNKPDFVVGDPSQAPLWNDVSPAADPAAEIAGAVPVLVAALSDKEARVRLCAAKLADVVGLCSKEKPEPLIVALRDHWLAESDANLRLDIGIAMTRFSTPLVLEAISNGLRSDRLEIVSDAAALVDWTTIQLNDKTRADFERLVELTHHENDRLRSRAVSSLNGKAPLLLQPELERLATDKVDAIRRDCATALQNKPDPKFADVLFKLADDANEQVRIQALSSIGNLDHPASMKRLLPHLRDKKVHGYAVSALADMGGQDAVPFMMSELESGNDVGGMVYQHLRRLTGQRLEEKPEPWLAWWKQKKPMMLLPDHWIVQAVGFDNGGKELVTASNQSFITIRRWDLAGTKLISEIKLQGDKHGRQVRDGTLKFSGDRRRVIAATDAYVGIWDTTTGKLLKQLPFEAKDGIYDCAIDMLDCTPDLAVIVGHRALPGRLTLSYDAHVLVWDGASGDVLRTLIDKGATDLKALDLSTDGKRLVTTNGSGAKIWETTTGQLLRSIPNDNSGRKHSEPDVSTQYTSHVWSVQLSPDGKQLAMGDILGVKLLDATTGKLLQDLEGPYRYSSSASPGLVFSKDGQWLARLGTQEKMEGVKYRYVVPIWSTRTGAKLRVLQTEANDAEFSDDAQRLAVVFSDMQQALSMWSLNGDAADVEQPAGPGPHSRQDRVEENGHYVGKKAAEYIEQFKPTWGEPKLGLQYGIALTKPQRQFRIGERVPLVVFFRNASDKPIKFDTVPDFFGNAPKVLDAKGEPLTLDNVPLLGSIPHYHEKLEPGEALGPFYLSFGLGENPRPNQQHWHPLLKTPVAGQYKLTHSVSINVAGTKEGEPAKKDELTSSAIDFEIVDRAQALGSRTRSQAEPVNEQQAGVSRKKQVVEIRLVGGPKKEPLPNVKVEFTSGHGSGKKSFGTFTTDDAGWLKATLPVGFYYLHLSSEKEWPYLPYEKYWTQSSFGYGKSLNVKATDKTVGVEKWLGGERREQGFEAATQERPARITFMLEPAVELVLRAVDIETGKGIPGAAFYEEVAAGEDWAHPIYGDNLGTKFVDGSKALTGPGNLTDNDGYSRRWVGEKSEQSQFGVWKTPAGYELVEPKSEVAVITKLGQVRAEQVFKFRRVGRD